MFRGGCLARSAAPARAVLATSQTPALRPFRNQSAVCPAPFPAAAPAVFSLSDECEIRLGSATTLRRSPRALAAPRRYPLPSLRCSPRREKRPSKAAASASADFSPAPAPSFAPHLIRSARVAQSAPHPRRFFPNRFATAADAHQFSGNAAAA